MRRMANGASAQELRAEQTMRKKASTLSGALLMLREGTLSFEAFQVATHASWWALATRLYKRWKPPTGVDVADVYQELLINAWLFVPQWDDQRGVEIERYVVYNASDKAKKVLHKLRGAKLSGSSDCNPTRGEYVTDDGDCTWEPDSDVWDEEILDRRYHRAKELSTGASMVDTLVLMRLAATFSVETTAYELYKDPSIRLALHLGCEAQSRTLVRKVVKRTATRVAVGHIAA